LMGISCTCKSLLSLFIRGIPGRFGNAVRSHDTRISLWSKHSRIKSIAISRSAKLFGFFFFYKE
jgi:hypothetical protein